MRVIAGQWRGRRLQAPVGEDVRPTTDRTKEALFSILGPQVVGSVVLDLCCGAGGLGVEALSRGAGRAVFVDAARRSLTATAANLARCGAPAGSYVLEQGDALAWLARWPGTGGQPWLLLGDPPYPSEVAGAMIRMLQAGGLPPGLVCAVIEHGSRTPGLPALGPDWQQRRYGQSQLAVFRPGAAAPRQESIR